jgi:hypothetical protein
VTNHQPTDPPTDEISQAELIRRLRRQCDMEGCCMACEPVGVRNQQLEGMLEVMREQVEHYVSERDEARREVCALEADTAEDQREFARQRGWDCFRNTTEPPLVSDESAGRLE